MTCTVEGCEKPSRSSRIEVCEMHYYRHRRTGSYDLLARPKVIRPGCEAPQCDRVSSCTVDGLSLCPAHRRIFRRTGEVTGPVKAHRTERGLCIVPACEESDDGPSGYCKMHMTRIRRHGSPETVIPVELRALPTGPAHPRWAGETATYSGLHQRLRRVRGRASVHACIDCGGQAIHWSYNHQGKDERTSEAGPYSLGPHDYDPRCARCHKEFDLQHLGVARGCAA